ncbi:MAG TPA: HAD family hydrolase [Minicystis sp.]|nr:HAD family hydrolase [Minicystis sp.]
MSTPFFSRRLPAHARAGILDDIVARVRAQRASGGAAPVVVFDLDGTLLDNRPRVTAILHELAAAWRERHPKDADACARANPDDIVYGFIDNLVRLGVTDPARHAEGLAFWKARFFTDLHQRHDVEVRGARAYVRAVHEAGAVVVYLTGRDLPGMALGSFASLRDLGFPIGVIGAELVVKPTFEMPDAAFKRDVAPELARLGEVVAAFDNEAANVNLFLEAHPSCAAVFLDTQYAPDPPPLDARARVIEHFERAR